jgi:hypothetical protein
MASIIKKDVGRLYKGCDIDLYVYVTRVSLYQTVLGSYGRNGLVREPCNNIRL